MENGTAAKPEKGIFKKLLKAAAFFAALLLLLSGANAVLMDNNIFAGRNVAGFYELEPDTLDAVYIGSSRVYAFWTPLFAFKENGITVFNFATAAQPIEAARYIVEEAHKTQKNALMIVNLETAKADDVSLHRVTDRFRFSLTKVKLVDAMCEKTGTRRRDRLEYFIPLIRYHSRWQELTEEDFIPDTGRYMSSSTYDGFLSGCSDVTATYLAKAGSSVTPDEATCRAIDGLIDYCDSEGIRLLFTLAPQSGVDEQTLAERTGLRDYAVSKGATVLFMQDSLEEIGLDLTTDYVNERHTNIHGSVKFTRYVAKYLIDNYGFTDKRSDPAYADWRGCLADYEELIAPYITPGEI